MKSKPARESTRPKRPYDASKSNVKRKKSTALQPSCTATSSLSPSTLAKFSSTPRPGAVQFRETCLDFINKFYPKTKPRNDWDVMQLGTQPRRNDDPAALYAWLDADYAQSIQTHGRAMIDESVKTVLDAFMEQSGRKPRAHDPLVFVRPIPDSKYSIRLFPGSLSRAEYCMDFIDTKTGEPVNSPFEHELWSVPNSDTPWLTMPMVGKLRSAERGHGIKQDDILPGEEKYFLRDGQTCILTRPGKRSVRFTVPIRRRPEIEEIETMDVLDFPKVVDP